MTAQDLLLVAMSLALGAMLGGLVAFGQGFPARGNGGDDAERRRAQRLETGLDLFDSALVLFDGGAPILVAGDAALGAVAEALGVAGADAPRVIEVLGDLGPEHARRLDALASQGEACSFRVAGPAGAVLIEGRSSGAWAWLRLAALTTPNPDAPEAEPLRALIDSQDDPAWISSCEGKLEWVSRGWLEAVNVTSLDDARDRGVMLDRATAALARQAASGSAGRLLSWITVARGRRAFQISATPLRGGSVALWARDVTELEASRDQSRRQADANALILNHIGDAVAVFDSDCRMVFHNPALGVLWEVEPAWLAERPTHAEFLDRLRQRRRLPETTDYARFKADELACYHQVEEATETIWRLPSERTLRLVRLQRPDGGIALVFSDITPELRLKSQFNHLIQVQRATLDKLNDAVAVFGADGRLKLHNEAFEAFWGIGVNALQISAEFDDVVELCVPRLHDLQFWRDVKARITDPDHRARAPSRAELLTADRRVVAFQSRPLPDGATLIGFADMTDTRRLEEALRDREGALAEAERLKSAFVGSVSYELRTPLTTIIGYAELLERGVDSLPERERSYIAAVKSAATHLARSINDVLATAEIDAGESVLELGDVDIGELLKSAVARNSEESAAAKVSVVVSADSDIGLMTGDGVRLGQVLDHLIENALRHTPRDGLITLSAVRAPGEVRISVADNGRGFPFDVQAHIFDRFSSHNRGGPGLGLALVRSLIDLHGGWVALESEPGAGANFTCHLPEVAQASEARPLLI